MIRKLIYQLAGIEDDDPEADRPYDYESEISERSQYQRKLSNEENQTRVRWIQKNNPRPRDFIDNVGDVLTRMFFPFL